MQLRAGKPAVRQELPGHQEESHCFPVRTHPGLPRDCCQSSLGPFTRSRTVLQWDLKIQGGEYCGVFCSCFCPCSVCSLLQATLQVFEAWCTLKSFLGRAISLRREVLFPPSPPSLTVTLIRSVQFSASRFPSACGVASPYPDQKEPKPQNQMPKSP